MLFVIICKKTPLMFEYNNIINNVLIINLIAISFLY